MKKVVLLCLILCTSLVSAQNEGTELTVKISNVSGDEGKVYFSLFNEATFMKADPLKTQKAVIKNGVATVTFEKVPPGEYGVISYHDRNDNGSLDFNAQGIPLESYGATNNVMNFGPPQWSDAKFAVGEDPLELEIRF